MPSNRELLLFALLGVGLFALYNRQKTASAVATGASSAGAAISRAVYPIINAGETLMTGEPRGIRNNNPGNIEFDPNITWNGQTGQDSGGYLTFATPLDGIRAMALDLKNAYLRDGLDTIQGLINRWAPPSSNNTAAYIADVSTRTGIPADVPFNVAQNLQPVVTAIIWHENGQQPYSPALIAQGCSLALAA